MNQIVRAITIISKLRMALEERLVLENLTVTESEFDLFNESGEFNLELKKELLNGEREGIKHPSGEHRAEGAVLNVGDEVPESL